MKKTILLVLCWVLLIHVSPVLVMSYSNMKPISVLDENPDSKPYTVKGPVIDLFDPQLSVLSKKVFNPGEQSLL